MWVFTAKPVELRPDNVLVLTIASQGDVDALRQRSAPGEGIGDHLKQAVFDVLGFRPLLLPRAEAPRSEAIPVIEVPPPADIEPEPTEPDIEPGMSWATAVIADAEPQAVTPAAAPTASLAPVASVENKQRYGEAVVREILGANFIEEQAVAPRVAPREQ